MITFSKLIRPSLPDDCIYDILQHLRGDRSTLYTCLFVNHFWCSCVVPLLWCQPFSSFRCWALIVRTYIYCLDNSALASLIPFNIYIPTTYKPLFTYERYLEAFSISDMENGIITWLRINTETRIRSDDDRIRPIMNAFWHMFLNRCRNLASININTGYGTSDLPELDVFLNARPGLSKLRSLDCCIGHKSDEISNYQNTMNLLRNWPVQSSNLTKMWVSVYEDRITPNDLISSIVKAQRNLKEFKFAGIGTFTQNVISALKHHAHSLTSLKLWMLVLDGISFDGLVSLEKLESLDIQWCEGISIDHCFALSDASFNLTSLSIWDNPSSPDITATLIIKAGKSLKDLKTDMITKEMIDVANKYCPNITHLCIKIKNENYVYFFPWIKNLKLEHLDFFSHEDDASDGIRLLGEYIPPTVIYLNLDYATYTPRSFNYFLNVCEANIITMIIRFSKELIDGCFEDILEFARRKRCMRTLAFICTPICWMEWSEKELELIEDMKKCNVKVVKSISRKF
ncbi:hypothetical protein C2G38_2198521 [Gigaspora rosea]|uniref:F-box domain-containing protein n=1 Tax=Gigaspora rosea TaxID=44941 RepID=A0A397UUZ7_9GLOM|nr:hypothetical protein C2G38_2198521 [Gigaspora rosea]